VKFTRYFHEMKKRPDRAFIRLEWIEQAVNHPIRQVTQADGRIRRWSAIDAMNGQYLRVVLLPDGVTVHNAFSTAPLSRKDSHEDQVLSRH
jgi:hypothetical protein